MYIYMIIHICMKNFSHSASI